MTDHKIHMIGNAIKLSVSKRKISKLIKERAPEKLKIPVRSIGIIADLKNIKTLEVLEGLKYDRYLATLP